MLTNSDQHTHQIMEFMRLYIFHRALTLNLQIVPIMQNWQKLKNTLDVVSSKFKLKNPENWLLF